MRRGAAFPVPERPQDVAALWDDARAVRDRERPDWFTPECAGLYRRVDPNPSAARAGTDALAAEFAELEQAGLIVERDPAQPWRSALFVPQPWPEPWFSIGVYRGATPFGLVPLSDAPVMTAADVTDVVATYVADPFVVGAATRFLFFEVYNWRANKGEIAFATSRDGLTWRYEGVVLAEPFHLSYPHVFSAGGQWYMTPESAQAGAVRLYRADRFPDVWTCIGTLVERPYLADPTVFEHGGRWWLLAEAGDGTKYDELRLYGADAVYGPWREHPASPIVRADPSIARPAGRVVTFDGRLVRFAQDCGAGYGTAVRALAIDRLDGAAYAESRIGPPVLGPGGQRWNATGMHHIDLHADGAGGWLAYVDGRDAPEDRNGDRP